MTFDTCRLSDLANIQGGYAFKSEDFGDIGEAVIKIANIQPPFISFEKVDRVRTSKLEGLERFKLQDGDILMAMTGATVGKVGRFKEIESAYLNQRVARITSKKSGLYGDFIYALVSQPEFEKLIKSFSLGSAQANISAEGIGSIQIPLLSEKQQLYIGGFVSLLDERIMLLRESSATLEGIAQTLFKSWFLDFDPVRAKHEGRKPEGMGQVTAALFPDSFEQSELGSIPKGWSAKALKNLCDKVESGGTPRRNDPSYWSGSIDWLTSGEVRSPIVLSSKEKISDVGLLNSSAKIWPPGTTIVAMYGATAGEVCMLAESMSANQACCGLIPKEGFRSFLFLKIRQESQKLAAKSTGSAQQNLNKDLVGSHPSLLPPNEVVVAFESLVGNFIDKWIYNERQTQSLSNLRDALLPCLISGQLRLPDAEETNEAT